MKQFPDVDNSSMFIIILEHVRLLSFTVKCYFMFSYTSTNNKVSLYAIRQKPVLHCVVNAIHNE